MYGKLFVSMYEGSMVGAGANVFALWGYCIAKADPEDHTVILNPELLAKIIGTTAEEISKSLTFLTSPDPNSKNGDHGGCRLLHQSGFQYFLVSHEHYRNIKNSEDVRAYNREMKRRERERKALKVNVNDSHGQVNDSASASVSDIGDCQGGHTLAECLAASEGIGMKPDDVKKFFDYYDGVKGWGTIKGSLKSALSYWKSNSHNFDKPKSRTRPVNI
jgi:hypothetical protein